MIEHSRLVDDLKLGTQKQLVLEHRSIKGTPFFRAVYLLRENCPGLQHLAHIREY
jgi:hypothetical protein